MQKEKLVTITVDLGTVSFSSLPSSLPLFGARKQLPALLSTNKIKLQLTTERNTTINSAYTLNSPKKPKQRQQMNQVADNDVQNYVTNEKNVTIVLQFR